jgi:[acyl-carrier-protein] S-malonyltransferase
MATHKTAWLFPGQGSQSVGMGRDLCKEFPLADGILELAGQRSGLPLKEYCWQGPDESLSRTDILQPALTAVCLGCAALLRHAGYRPDMVAGHSLGEFPALHAAGVLSDEDTLRLVIERGRLMLRAAEAAPGGMIAVKKLTAEQADEVAAAARTRGAVVVANYNSPAQVVLSGEAAALAEAEKLVVARGGEPVRLRVSGPWHSPLMEQAAASFRAVIEQVTFRPPETPIYLNTKGAPESDPQAIREAMCRQIASPVYWSQSIQGMIQDGVKYFVEVGPGKVLRGLLRQIWPDEKAYTVRGVDKPRSLENLAQDKARLAP